MMMWSLSSIVRCSGRVENRAIMVVFLDVSVLGLVLLAHMPISRVELQRQLAVQRLAHTLFVH